MTDLDYSKLFPQLARKYGEDIAQEALVRCWQSPALIDYLPAYAHRVALNLKLAQERLPRARMLVFRQVLPEVTVRPSQLAYVELGELVRKLPALVWDGVGYPLPKLPGQTLEACRSRRFRLRKNALASAEEPPAKPLTGGA